MVTFALLFLSATTAIAAATAQVAETFPVQLSRQDRGAVTRAVCPDAAASEADIHAFTAKRGAATVQVEVQCKPHRVDGPFPIARRASCSNRTGQWRCDDAHEAAHADIPMVDDSVAVIPVGLTPRAAAEIVVEASRLLAPPFSEPGRWYYGGECRVGKSSLPAKRDIEPFDLLCRNGRLLVSRYCTNGRCNYFIVSASRGKP